MLEIEKPKIEQSNAAKSLAIVPFRLLKGEHKTPLGVGLADALTIRLHGIQGLSVLPTGSVLPLAEKIEDSFELGRRLGVDYVLDGHILPVGTRTRFSVQLLDIASRSLLWASQFDETEADIFHLEDSISTRVVEHLLPHFAEQNGAAKPENADKIEAISPATGEIRESDTAEEEIVDVSQHETLILPPAVETKKSNFPLIAVISLIAVAVSALGFYFLRSKKQNVITQPKTLVVLPFKSENSAANSIGVGLADALTSKFGTIRALSVLSSNTGRQYSKTPMDAETIGRELQADFVLRGSLENQNDKLRLSAELLDIKNNTGVFAETFEAANSDFLALQIQIADKVLQSLEISPTDEERAPFGKRPTESALAYELYLIGRYQMLNRSPENLRRAIQTFKQAIERDPNFALPYIGIADCNSLLMLYEIPKPADGYQNARENALRALALDENLGEAHASLAYVKFNDENDRPGAEKEYRRAIELNPSYTTAHHWFALALSAMGRHDEAAAEMKIAQRLDPRAPVVYTAASMVYFHAERYEEGLKEAARAFEIDPGFVPGHKAARWIYQAQGDYRNALASFQKERSFSGADEKDLGWWVIESQVEAIGGNRQKSLALLERAMKDQFVRENPKAFAFEIALAYAANNDKDNAIRWIEKSFEVKDHSFCFLTVDPRLKNLHNDPRFIALIPKLEQRY